MRTMSTWRDVWRSPALDGDELTERARTAHTILVAGSVLLAIALVVSVAMHPRPVGGHAPYAAMLLLHVGALCAIRRGALRVAILGFATVYVALVVAVCMRAGGLTPPAGFALPPVVLFVGLTLSGRAAFVTAVVASLSALGIVLLARHGALPPPDALPPIRLWLVATVALAITAFMLYVALRVIRESRRARVELEERLLQSRRLEAVGRLAAGVAHDFNNVLTVVFAEASRLRRRGDARTAASAEIIHEAAERAAALTRQLLAFGSREVRAPEPLDLSQVVDGVRRLLQRFVGDDIAFEVELAPGLDAVRADRTELEQVLLNLVTNARDAMPSGGTLRLRTGRDAAGMVLEVSDTGVGMEPAVRAKIFEPFFTTKAVGKGTGLGLATVHRIVAGLGGAIRVDSAPGAGTTFTVVLPAIARAPSPAASADAPRMARGTPGAAIVVVDDDGQVRAAVEAMVVEGGHKVSAARSGREVLDAAAGWTHPPDLVLLDVVMPDMTGPELAARLRVQHPALRILFMSGHAEAQLSERGVLLDGVHFVAKPFERATLLDKIEAVLAAEHPGATGRGTMPA